MVNYARTHGVERVADAYDCPRGFSPPSDSRAIVEALSALAIGMSRTDDKLDVKALPSILQTTIPVTSRFARKSRGKTSPRWTQELTDHIRSAWRVVKASEQTLSAKSKR